MVVMCLEDDSTEIEMIERKIEATDDIEKELESKIIDDEFMDIAQEFMQYMGRTDQEGVSKKVNLMEQLLRKLFSKLPNAVKFVQLLDSDTPKIGFEKILLSEKVRSAFLFLGNTYNEQSARIKYKTGQNVGDFNDYLDVLLGFSTIIEYFRLFRPDLYQVLVDVELNREKCILGKLNEALVYARDELKKLPYKHYTIKKKKKKR